ncbi:MAG: hypothetical protein ACTSRP_22055 [Candidatus Helarchaeota archaeon]
MSKFNKFTILGVLTLIWQITFEIFSATIILIYSGITGKSPNWKVLIFALIASLAVVIIGLGVMTLINTSTPIPPGST